jgi:hypothetical protein
MSSILGQSDAHVFACPKCGEMINTSMAQCAYCNAPVDPQWAVWAAGAQATISSAFSNANTIMQAARGMVVLTIATSFPFLGGYAAIVLFLMIFAFPILVLIWFSKYQWGLQGIDKNQDDLKQSRSRIMKAAIIYGVAIIAWPIITMIRAIVDGLLATM